MASPGDEKARRRRSVNKIILLTFGALAALVLVIVLVGAVTGNTGDHVDVATGPSATTPDLETPSGEPLPGPGCESTPPDVLATINGSLAAGGTEFAETAAVRDGDRLYVAGEIHRLSDGAVVSRDDLFVQSMGAVTPVSATARSESSLPDLRDSVGVEFSDPGAQRAADCARTY